MYLEGFSENGELTLHHLLKFQCFLQSFKHYRQELGFGSMAEMVEMYRFQVLLLVKILT